MTAWIYKHWLIFCLRMLQRGAFLVDMELIDGSSAKGKVRYRIGFKMKDGGEDFYTGYRIYEEGYEDGDE